MTTQHKVSFNVLFPGGPRADTEWNLQFQEVELITGLAMIFNISALLSGNAV